MKKFKIFWNMDKEEKYLNEMAQKGHILKKFSIFGIYHFVDSEPQELNYKVDYKLFKTKADFESYRALFEDAGWEHICGSQNSGSQYFLPKTSEAGKEIFSDKESAAARYKTLYNLCVLNGYAAALSIFIVLYLNNFKFSAFGFLTPGLWEKTGAFFWGAFFFELPFVILRVGATATLFVMAIAYGYWGGRAKKEYEREMEEGKKL